MRVCLPEEISIELPRLGLLVLRPQVLDIEATPAWIVDVRHSCEEVSVECSGGAALLIIERGSACFAVNAMLGYEMAAVAGPLSRIERGILQGMLVALSAHLGLPPDVRLRAGQAPVLDLVAIEVSLRMRGVTGRAWVCASEDFLTKSLALKTPEPAQATIRVELGCTRVPVSELAAAKEGDAVVFDGASALSVTAPWPVQIRRGKAAIPAYLYPDGTLAIAGGNGNGSAEKADRPSCPTISDSVAGSAKKVSCLDVTAEIGCLRGDALAGLLKNHVAMGRGDPILLRVDETPWAEGEIVAIEGELAVRITRRLAG
jgi:flagellar motor switch/type III secretory pathway protein FliN